MHYITPYTTYSSKLGPSKLSKFMFKVLAYERLERPYFQKRNCSMHYITTYTCKRGSSMLDEWRMFNVLA